MEATAFWWVSLSSTCFQCFVLFFFHFCSSDISKLELWLWVFPNSVCVCAQSCLTLIALWTKACQASLSIGVFRREYWNGAATSSFRGSSWPRDQTHVSCTAGGFFICSAIREVLVPKITRQKSKWVRHMRPFKIWVPYHLSASAPKPFF